MSGHDLRKINKRPHSIKRPPTSSPKFEMSAPGVNSRIYGRSNFAPTRDWS